jgi:hypothetical protein
MTLLDLSPADFRRFVIVLVDRRLLGSQCCLSTGLVARFGDTNIQPIPPRNINPTVPYGGSSVMVWGCISHDCKLDLSPADFRRFLIVLVDRRLLGSQCCLSTGLVANDIRLTKRCNALS